MKGVFAYTILIMAGLGFIGMIVQEETRGIGLVLAAMVVVGFLLATMGDKKAAEERKKKEAEERAKASQKIDYRREYYENLMKTSAKEGSDN